MVHSNAKTGDSAITVMSEISLAFWKLLKGIKNLICVYKMPMVVFPKHKTATCMKRCLY